MKNNRPRPILKIKIMLALVVLLSFSTAPVHAFTHTITFSVDDFSFSTVDGFDLVLLKDGAYLTDVGKPKLPAKSLRVAIPAGATIAGITINETERLKLHGSFHIYPFQEFKAEFLPPRPFATPDPAVYGQIDEYPGCLVVRVGESHPCGSHNIAHLLVFPLQYVPKDKNLYLYTSITFTLTIAKKEKEAPAIRVRSATSQASCDLYVKETVANPEDVDTYKVSPAIIWDKSMDNKPVRFEKTPVNTGTNPSEYIIITSDMTMADQERNNDGNIHGALD